jgi:hypothetical protein
MAHRRLDHMELRLGRTASLAMIPEWWSGVLVRGQDGVAVDVPYSHKAVEGADGRVAAIPPDHTAWQGQDGRMVAVPLGYMVAEGPDGRAVPLAPGTMGLADWRGRIREI